MVMAPVVEVDMGSQYLRNVAAQGIGRAVSFGANFVSFVIIARIGGTELFGQYSYVLTFLGIFAAAADFGMCTALGKDIAQVEESADVYWGNFLLLRAAINAAVVPIAIITAFYARRDLFPVLMIGSLAIPFLAARFFEPIFQVYGRPWHSTYSSLAYGLCYLILLAAAAFFAPSLIVFVIAFIFSNVAYAVAAFSMAGKSLRPRFVVDWPTIKGITKFILPLGVSYLFIIVNGRIPILMLAAMKSDRAVAVFNAAYRFFDLSAMLGAALVVPFLPLFSGKALAEQETLKAMFVVIIEVLAVFVVPVAIIVPVVSPYIVTAFFGQAFAESAHVLNIIAWTCVVVFYSLFASAAAFALGMVNFSYWNTGCAALISIVLNYLLIPRHSYLGSAWTSLVCELFLAGVVLAVVMGRLGNVFHARKWMQIVGLNLAAAVFLHANVFSLEPSLKAVMIVPLYSLAVWRLRLVSVGSFTSVFRGKSYPHGVVIRASMRGEAQ
jgi:O-antigen/teichoic acid export membrane protein